MVGWYQFRLDLVSLVHGVQQVRSLVAYFGYRLDACERWLFLAIGVTLVSLRLLITVRNLGVWSCLDIV
jgi:hypothetical protein